MKRQLEQTLIKPAASVKLLDLTDPLVAWLWQPCFTDVTTLLAFHKTCRYLWRLYSERDLALLESQWEAKTKHHRVYNLKSAFYTDRHHYCLLRLLKLVTHVNAVILTALNTVNERLAQDEEIEGVLYTACDNPLATGGILYTLGEMPKFLMDDEDAVIHDRGRFILGVVQRWVKCRYGWDLAIGNETTMAVHYSEGFLDNELDNLSDYLCVCNDKYISAAR